QSQLTAQLVAAHLRILIQQGLNLGQMRRAERASLQAGWQKHSRRDWQKGRSESRKKRNYFHRSHPRIPRLQLSDLSALRQPSPRQPRKTRVAPLERTGLSGGGAAVLLMVG